MASHPSWCRVTDVLDPPPSDVHIRAAETPNPRIRDGVTTPCDVSAVKGGAGFRQVTGKTKLNVPSWMVYLYNLVH